jgi:hypothetical protein
MHASDQSLRNNAHFTPTITGVRYMDDLLIVTSHRHNDPDTYNHSLTLVHAHTNAYDKSLELEHQPGDNNKYVFLESIIYNHDDHLILKPYQKNYPFVLQQRQQKFLNLQHFHSYTPTKTKLAVLISALYRLQRNSSTYTILRHATYKLYFELSLLSYSFHFLLKAVYHIQSKTQSQDWLTLHSDMIRHRYNITQMLDNQASHLHLIHRDNHEDEHYDLTLDPF